MKTKLLLVTVGILMLCGGACPPPPPPRTDPVTEAECKTACEHFRELACEEAKPTANGVTCEEVCSSMPSNQAYLECAATIETCPKLQACPQP